MKDNIDYWQCPNKHCKYKVSHIEYQSIRIDPLCRCKEFNWSDFNPKESMK